MSSLGLLLQEQSKGGLVYNFRHGLRQTLSINSLTYSWFTTASQISVRWGSFLCYSSNSVEEKWAEKVLELEIATTQ